VGKLKKRLRNTSLLTALLHCKGAPIDPEINRKEQKEKKELEAEILDSEEK